MNANERQVMNEATREKVRAIQTGASIGLARPDELQKWRVAMPNASEIKVGEYVVFLNRKGAAAQREAFGELMDGVTKEPTIEEAQAKFGTGAHGMIAMGRFLAVWT